MPLGKTRPGNARKNQLQRCQHQPPQYPPGRQYSLGREYSPRRQYPPGSRYPPGRHRVPKWRWVSLAIAAKTNRWVEPIPAAIARAPRGSTANVQVKRHPPGMCSSR